MLSERVKLAAEKAAMVAEVSLLQESGSLAQERLRLEHKEKLLKLRTKIAKTEAKEKVYEEFNAVEEKVPDHPCKFTLLPHVEPREVFERGLKPLNCLSNGVRIVELLISKVVVWAELEGSRVWAWRCWKLLAKCSHKGSNKSKPRNFPRLRLCLLMEIL